MKKFSPQSTLLMILTITLITGIFGIIVEIIFTSYISTLLFFDICFFILFVDRLFLEKNFLWRCEKLVCLIFLKKKKRKSTKHPSFELELTAAVLAYEIARSDGEISDDELSVLMQEIEKISQKVNRNKEEILKIVEIYSKDSVSFHEFIEDINKNYSKEEKISLLKFMWQTAYADGKLDVDEERLVRRVADLINIKDIEVLKLKDDAKN